MNMNVPLSQLKEMKRPITPILLFFFCLGSAMSQPAILRTTFDGAKEFVQKPKTIGFRMGSNFSTLFGDTYKGLGFRSGMVLGAYTDIPLSDNFSLLTEASLSLEGAKNRNFKVSEEASGVYIQTLKYNYLQVPVLANFTLGNELSLQAGLQMGLKLAAKESRYLKEGSHNEDVGYVGTRNYTNRIKIFYPSLIFGLGYPLPFAEGVTAQARIQTSVFDNVKKYETNSQGTHPFILQLALSYEIWGK